MNEQKLSTVAQLRAFLDGTEEVQFEPLGEDSKRYAFIAGVSLFQHGMSLKVVMRARSGTRSS